MNTIKFKKSDQPAWMTRKPGRITSIGLFLFAAYLLFGAGLSAQGIVNVALTGKSRSEYEIWFTELSFDITMSMPGLTPPPSPTFTVDLYDEDSIWDDGRDVDLTENSQNVKVTKWVPRGAGGVGALSYRCTVSTGIVREWDVTDPLPYDYPDPRVEIVVTVGGSSVSVDHCAPDLPSVGLADFGIDSPSAFSNNKHLDGVPISAMSRGHDEIAFLPWKGVPDPNNIYTAALYFSCEHQSPVPSSDKTSGPGRIFVLDYKGDLWPEDLYDAKYDPDKNMMGTPSFLNVNNTTEHSQQQIDQMYFVLKGTHEILYSATGDPGNATLFYDVPITQAITGLAVLDMGTGNVWSPYDKILYSIEGSSAIYFQEYGSQPVFYSSPDVTFDGSTTMDFKHFDINNTNPSSFTVGNITALSVSNHNRIVLESTNRIVPYMVDHKWLSTYGSTDGGQIGFLNNPVIGSSDFKVTLTNAGAGAWALLYVGVPIPMPGISIPPHLPSSTLLLDPNSCFPFGQLTKTLGGATQTLLPIPNMPELVCTKVGFQWFILPQSMYPIAFSDVGVAYLR